MSDRQLARWGPSWKSANAAEKEQAMHVCEGTELKVEGTTSEKAWRQAHIWHLQRASRKMMWLKSGGGGGGPKSGVTGPDSDIQALTVGSWASSMSIENRPEMQMLGPHRTPAESATRTCGLSLCGLSHRNDVRGAGSIWKRTAQPAPPPSARGRRHPGMSHSGRGAQVMTPTRSSRTRPCGHRGSSGTI